MTGQLKVLLVEDVAFDAELTLNELKRARLSFEARRVDTEGDYRQALQDFSPGVILSDFTMPAFDGLTALSIAHELRPDIPFIFVSGTIGEEHAIRALKNGATDYVLKGNLLRLPPAIERAVADARHRAERDHGRREHEEALTRLENAVSGLRDVIWSVALPSRELLYVSPSITTEYRQAAREFLEHRLPWSGLIHPDDRARVHVAWEKSVQSGQFDCEHRIVLPDGGIRWIHNRGQSTPAVATGGSRMDGIAQDITGRHEQQDRLARLNRVLVRTLRNAVIGKRRISSCFVEFLERGLEASKDQLSHAQLSDRELQILLLIGSGKSIKQIAAELSISVNTANTYRTRILRKMGWRTNAALIRYVVENGLIE
jgi:DNA-binding NarL/FixJ family response regulator